MLHMRSSADLKLPQIFPSKCSTASASLFLLLQKIDIGKFDRDFWRVPVLSEL